MALSKKARYYFTTISQLKWIQIQNRVLRRFKKIDCTNPTPMGLRVGTDLKPPMLLLRQSLFNVTSNDSDFNPTSIQNRQYRFLNHTVSNPQWNDETQQKLWLYNLHYFDDLNAHGALERVAQHQSYINDWISENPAPLGNGWEPYPVSLRIVNWIKFFNRNVISDDQKDSLQLQASVLTQILEYHLLGNHLFANAKALLFAGCFFSGEQADEWLTLAEKLLLIELDEQFLEDGANFELTPMYHAIMTVDCLDLWWLTKRYPGVLSTKLIDKLQTLIPKQLYFLEAMCHMDGDVSFFNDSAQGIAPPLHLVQAYAKQLHISTGLPENEFKKISHRLTLGDQNDDLITIEDFKQAKYVVASAKDFKMIADLAEIGPSYIAGHAHADSLSFELSLWGKRLLVNSGTGEYGLSSERLRQRKTPAHNTVSINGYDSTEVWSGFRVAKRASICGRQTASVKEGRLTFSASHDGFKKQGLNNIHKRSFAIQAQNITLLDTIDNDFTEAKAYFHLHPTVTVEKITTEDNNNNKSKTTTVWLRHSSKTVKICFSDIDELQQIASTYHPEFGITLNNTQLAVTFSTSSLTTVISWDN